MTEMDCAGIPTLEYGDFRQRLREKTYGKRIPLSGSFELSFRCNLRCQHCYVAHGHTGIPGEQELSLGEIERILDEITAEDCLWLLITGGEPLIRRDFEQIWLAARSRGLLLSLFTNGTLLTPQKADFLAENPPFKVEITLYGRTQATYERITGIPGSHQRCYRGIELLMERGIPLRLKTMLMTLNQHELADMQAFAESLGVNFRYDGQINAGVDGSGRPISLRLPPEKLVQIENSDGLQVNYWKERLDSYAFRERPSTLYACSAGYQSFHIDPYGKLSLCMMSRQVSYDLRRGSFHEGWNETLRRERYQPVSNNYACKQCNLFPICASCPGWSIMEHGNAEQPVSYLCQIAHLRAQAVA